MGDINTSEEDENTIDQVRVYGLRTPNAPKYRILRLALSKSLRMDTPPESDLDTITAVGKPYSLEQVTGYGKETSLNFDDACRALLSVYHEEDLFAADAPYTRYLQRHIRRGLREIRTSWQRGHNFIAWLREELFPDTAPTEPETPAMDMGAVAAALKEIGVQAEIREIRQGIRLDRFSLYLSNIHHLDALKRGLDKLAFLLAVQEGSLTLTSGTTPSVAELYIPRPPSQWKTVPSLAIQQWAAGTRPEKLPIWLGQTPLGEDFSTDLAEAPHLLIAGTTGSGKTVCIHNLICSLLYRKNPQSLQLALVDPKGTEFSAYALLPNLFGGKVAKTILETADLLNALVEEMEARNRSFAEMHVRSIDEIDGKSAPQRIVLVVEELADLLIQAKELESPLVRLAQKARSVGIHLVLATQRPDSATFSGLLRSNIPARIALRVQKHTESTIILDQKGAESLLGKGDMLVKLPDRAEPVRVHGAYLEHNEINRAIRQFAAIK